MRQRRLFVQRVGVQAPARPFVDLRPPPVAPSRVDLPQYRSAILCAHSRPEFVEPFPIQLGHQRIVAGQETDGAPHLIAGRFGRPAHFQYAAHIRFDEALLDQQLVAIDRQREAIAPQAVEQLAKRVATRLVGCVGPEGVEQARAVHALA
ncbi:MAG: hypothetical protein ACREN6_00680, partial [Gemmatimonadaceae bacterium]